VPAAGGASIERATAADLPAAALALALAFRDAALNVAVIGADPDRRLRSNRHGCRALLPVAHVHGEVWVARSGGEVSGVLVAVPPFGWPLPPPAAVARLRCLLGQGWRVARRWGEAYEALEAIHPLGPHWYLASLGVLPGRQGRGLGSELLAAWLEGADSHDAYLETDLPRNVDFYRRRGFEVEKELRVQGIPVWCMRRPAPS
jgi:ribosomal protein S18 acetylase RimI-like enzyme